jgi:type IV pilus assembly protein PilP
MVNGVKAIVWMILLLGAGVAGAEEKVETPSKKTKEAVDALVGAPRAISKSLQDLSNAAKAKFQEALGEAKSTKANAAAPGEQNSDPRSPANISAVGKRDPFRPFTLNTRANGRLRENLSPLERYDLGQLRLVGIVWQVKEPSAMIEDSVGLGYIVKVGTPMGTNDGKVKAIKANEIIVEETYVDLFGVKKKREVNIKLSVEKAE